MTSASITKNKSWLVGAAALFWIGAAVSPCLATTPTVDPTVPAENSVRTSLQMRQQFQAIFNDETNLYSLTVPFGTANPGIVPLTGGVDNTHFLSAAGTWLTVSGGGGGGTITLGTSVSLTNPQVSGDATTGLYSDAAATIKFSNSGTSGMAIGTNGVTMGTPSGSFEGAGKLNAIGLYVGGVAVLTANQTITLSGDATGSGTTAITVTNPKVNGVAYGTSPSTNTVPVVTGTNAVTYETVPNAALANSSITVAGHSVSLGGSQAIAVSDLTAIGSNTVAGNFTVSSAAPAANAIPSCVDSGGNHLNYTLGTGLSCGTSDLHAGTVTSITFTGDGVVLSSTPSSAVTTSGTVAAVLASAAADTILGNATSGSAAPTYTTAPIVSGASTAASFNATTPATGYQMNGQNGVTYASTDSTTYGSVAIGSGALRQEPSLTSAAFHNTAVGYQALSSVSLTTAATNNTAVGYQAGLTVGVNTANTLVGAGADVLGSNDTLETGVGFTVHIANDTGNTSCFGANATCGTSGQTGRATGIGASVSVGQQATCVGYACTANAQVGATGVGLSATAQGLNSITLGETATQSGLGDIDIGGNSNGGNTSSANNIVMGYFAGTTITTGAQNIAIGSSAAHTVLTTGNGNILIGNGVTAAAAGTNNSLNIANLLYGTSIGTAATGSIGIGTATPLTALDVAGPVKTQGYAIGSLPSGIVGMRSYVTDQLTTCPALSGTFTAGGSAVCSAFYNGTAWVHE